MTAFIKGGLAVRRQRSAFTLVEVCCAAAVIVIAFAGLFATVSHSGRMVARAEEDSLCAFALEQRVDQLRTLEWGELTDGTGIRDKVWTSLPNATGGVAVTQERITVSPYDLPTAKTLTATWAGTGATTLAFSTASQELGAAGAVKVVATLTWTGKRSARPQTRTLILIITKGGISKSDL